MESTGTIVEANPAARALYDYAQGALQGSAMTALIHPDDRARFIKLMSRLPEETNLRTEAQHVRQDGTAFDVDVRLSTFDYRGSPHILAIVRDISERKQMERTMQERVKELTCLYGISRDVQENLSVEALCRRIVKRLGPAMKFPEIAVPVIALDGSRFGAGTIDGNAVRTLHADIKVRGVTRGQVSVTYVEDRPFVIPEEQNLLNSVAEILGQRLLRRQVEYQREVAHDALEEQLTRVELLNQIARAMAARYDLDSILRVVTQRLEDGFTDQASIWLREDDRDTFTLASTGDQSRHAAARSGLPPQMVLPEDTGRSLLQGELRYWPDIAAIDTPRNIAALIEHLDVHAVVIAPLAAGGEVLGALVTARRRPDAFERRERDFLRNLAVHVGLILRQARLRQEIQAAYDDLRQTQQAVMQQERLKALGQMASGIAHDINNAIAPLPLYTSMLKREAGLSPDARARLGAIETAIGDVEETVARMRQFYRRPEETEALVPVDVNAIVNQAIDLTQPRWRDSPQEHGITIDLQTYLQDDLPPVMGLEGEIRQAVVNLIFNAVDAMPEGGTLILKTRERTTPPRHVILAVTDTGVGMDAETRKHCLEPFYSTKGEEGSGMGLATVFGTMQRHEGDVNVASAPGEGTTVQLSFPVRTMDQDAVETEPVAPPPPLRILCIDDEPLLRQALQETLEREGHTVTLADGGKSGLAAFHAAQEGGSPFDVVITDLGMPYVDGREVARTVKAASPSTPVILLTGWGVSLDAERDIPDAVDLVLGKPPMLDALNRALARVAASPSDSPQPEENSRDLG
jgi:PAS domain S-box-containing protein